MWWYVVECGFYVGWVYDWCCVDVMDYVVWVEIGVEWYCVDWCVVGVVV